MRILRACITGLVVGLAGAITQAQAQDDGPETRIFDSGQKLTAPLTAQALQARAGWRLVAEDILKHSFTGDSVLLNDQLAIVFRSGQPGPVVYSRATGKERAALGFNPGGVGRRELITGCTILENSGGGGKIETAFTSGDALTFRLTTGESILEIQAPQGTGSVQVASDSRYVLVSDYFGDDMVYAAGTDEGPIPAENFCLNLLTDGDGMLMTVWQSSEQEASLAHAVAGISSGHCLNRIGCRKDKSVWLALLEQPGIWHESKEASDSWRPPFAAKWRASRLRERHLADSWDAEHGPGAGQNAAGTAGPILTYPVDRSISTPLTVTCPTDVMRNTLGVGPCQYILACEGMASQGDPTPNSVMGWVEKQFEQKKQRKAADDIKERLAHMVAHVGEARARIERYAALSAQLRQSLGANPERAPWTPILDDLDRSAKTGLAEEAAPERAARLRDQVVQLLSQPADLAACQRLGGQLREIGAIQDRALARCRMAVRRLRQEARTSSDLALTEKRQEVQRVCDLFLRNK